MFVSSRLLAFARPVAGHIACTTALGVLAASASIAVSFAVTAIVAAVLAPGGATSATLAAPVIVAGLAVLARAGLLWAKDTAAAATGLRAKRILRRRLTDRIVQVGPLPRWQRGGDAVATSVVDGTEHVQAYLGLYVPQLIVALVVPTALIGVIAVHAPVVALVIAVCIVTIPVAQSLWSKLLGERAWAHWDAYEAYAARLADSIRGILTLASLGAVSRRARILAHDAERLRDATNANLRASLGIAVVTAAAMSIGTAGASLAAAWTLTEGWIAPTSALLVLFLAAECFRPLQELQSYWHEGFHAVAASEGIQRILDTEPLVEDRPGARSTPIPAAPSIAFEGVGYHHPGAERDALDDVTLAIPGGSTLAVVGRSGAGKSTLASLLLRDADPDRGRILLAGVDLREWALHRVSGCVVRVTQDVVLLDGSIRDNVLAGAPDAGDAALARAISAARVDEFIERTPEGLDTQVGEGGSALSGGQRQRVALARALLAGAPVLVLDEATSALDAENESLITDALAAQRGERTTIVIAHRLSTVMDADLVAVLDDGRCVEFGTPAQLRAANGRWARMLDVQLEATR